MLKKFLFADLDDTLFQSRRKCPDRDDLIPAAYLKDGTAHSFQTPTQSSLFKLFLEQATMIPVTARSVDAFRRVHLPFAHGAVVDYGGIILQPDGTPEPAWLDRSARFAAAAKPVLEATAEALRAASTAQGASVRVRIIEDFGVPLYVCAKSEEHDHQVLTPLSASIRRHCHDHALPVCIHRNGNNLTVLPKWLDKSAAVTHLIARLREAHGEILTIGMGDSLSDIAFMRACDFSLVPNRSQINLLLREAQHALSRLVPTE